MENLLKIAVIFLAAVTGLLFTASMCYGFAIGLSRNSDSPIPGEENLVAATALPEPPEKSATGDATETATPPSSQSPPAENAAPPAAINGINGTIDTNGLTWDGLQIEIANANYNAWPIIKAHNQYNDPPLDGMQMLVLNLRINNIEGSPDEPVELWASDFKLIGDRNSVYETFNVSCGVVPDDLNAAVPSGGSTDGNVCFQVSQTEQNFKLIYEPHNAPAIYFDVPGREDTDIPAVNVPPVLVSGEQVSQNGVQIGIVTVDYEAWPLIQAQNHNNEPPLEGRSMLLITVRATNTRDAVDAPPPGIRDADFQLIGEGKTIYKTYEASCGVIPDKLDGVIASGSAMDGNVCFQIPRDENDFQLIYEPDSSPAIYVPVPDWGFEK